MRRLAVALALGVLTLPSCNGVPEIPFPTPPPSGPYDCEDAAVTAAPFEVSPTGRYIVRRVNGAVGAAQAIQQLAQQFEMSNVEALGAINGFVASMAEANARELASRPGFLVAPDRVKSIPSPVQGNVSAESDPPGPVAGTRLWGLDRIDQRSLPLDGEFTPRGNSGNGVHAYIIDTGVSAHVDWDGRLGNGFSSVGGTPEDQHGHGTHVAGTVGGGQFGVAPAVTLHSVRVLNAQGSGSDSGVIQGIEWVQSECERHGEPCVANMSLGGDTSDALDLALCKLIGSGVFVAVAAGNDGLDACKYSPARVKQALTAMASDKRDGDASFSNVGPCGQCWAPGVDVTSARLGGGETTFSGTSMASPHLAGAAARILSEHPDWTQAQVYEEILRTATPGAIGSTESTPEQLLYVGY